MRKPKPSVPLNELTEDMGRRMRRFRRVRGWTLADLAAAMGRRSQEGHLAHLEHGHYMPHLQTVLDVANALGVLVTDLLPPQLTTSAVITWDSLLAAGMDEDAAAAMVLWLRGLDRGEPASPAGALP